MPSKFDDQRAAVKYFLQRGIDGTADICKRTGLSSRQVRKYKAKWRELGSLEDRPRSGRPTKITSTFRRQLGQVKARNPWAPAHTLARRMSELRGSAVSSKTVRKALHSKAYSWRLPGRKRLSSAQKAARLAFVEAHLDDAWRNTWSFDEAYFNLHRHSNKCWVSVTTEHSVQRSKLTHAQEKVSVGICFAFCRSRKSALCFLPGGWGGADLVKVFEEELLPSIQWPRKPTVQQRFIMDNDGRHQTGVWKEFAERRGLHPLSPWPANSPDLNPIENLFAWLKRYVENEGPTSEATLRAAIAKAYEAVPEEHLAHLMDSMPRRLCLARAAHGARIQY